MTFSELRTLVAGRMRARWLALRGASVGGRSVIGARLVAPRASGIAIGARATLEHDVYLKLVTAEAKLGLGEYTFIGRGCEFDVAVLVSVGSHTLIAPDCFVTDHAHGTSSRRRLDEQPSAPAPVVIGSDAWLGRGVTVLPGVTIGDGAVVGANSVVTRDVPPKAIVAGAPARLLRMRSADE